MDLAKPGKGILLERNGIYQPDLKYFIQFSP